MILRAHGKKGHGATFRCPITCCSANILVIIYVNDADLLHINFDKDEMAEEAHAAIQSSVNSWGNVLIATGGALKPEKCFYSILLFEWVSRIWRYKDNSISGSYGVTVPLPEGGSAAIAHRPVSHAEKTIGALTSPDGDSASAILQMQEKAQQWVDAVRNSHLHQQNVWFLLGVQFLPWVGFSICNSMATYNKLEHALQRQYFQILPLGGVIRTVPLNCRMVDAGFYCPGLPHPGVEALIAITNKLLMLFGCVCVCVFLSSGRRELPSDAVPTARQIYPPPTPARSYPRQTPHQPLPEEMLADRCPLGNVGGTATANFVGTIPWMPSDIPPGASLCDT